MSTLRIHRSRYSCHIYRCCGPRAELDCVDYRYREACFVHPWSPLRKDFLLLLRFDFNTSPTRRDPRIIPAAKKRRGELHKQNDDMMLETNTAVIALVLYFCVVPWLKSTQKAANSLKLYATTNSPIVKKCSQPRPRKRGGTKTPHHARRSFDYEKVTESRTHGTGALQRLPPAQTKSTRGLPARLTGTARRKQRRER